MQAFLLKLIIAALSNAQVQQVIKNILGSLITERVLPLLPLAAASAAKAVVDLIPGGGAAVADVVAVANTVRDDLNTIIPDVDIGIPALDDLIDFWRPKH